MTASEAQGELTIVRRVLFRRPETPTYVNVELARVDGRPLAEIATTWLVYIEQCELLPGATLFDKNKNSICLLSRLVASLSAL